MGVGTPDFGFRNTASSNPISSVMVVVAQNCGTGIQMQQHRIFQLISTLWGLSLQISGSAILHLPATFFHNHQFMTYTYISHNYVILLQIVLRASLFRRFQFVRIGCPFCDSSRSYVGRRKVVRRVSPCFGVSRSYLGCPLSYCARQYLGCPPCDGSRSYLGCPPCDGSRSYLGCPPFGVSRSYLRCPPYDGIRSYLGCPPYDGSSSYLGCPPFGVSRSYLLGVSLFLAAAEKSYDDSCCCLFAKISPEAQTL